MSGQNSKADWRREISTVLKNLPRKKRRTDSDTLRARLKEQDFFRGARSVLFFAPLPDEVDLWPLLEETISSGKVVALPCFDADNQRYASRRVENVRVEILSGQFGIREPSVGCIEMPLDDLELVLVPGVAFDLNGHRLGRGKGYYDRLLENFTGKKVGIAFDEQIVEAVPRESLDVRMDYILTPTRIVHVV